MASPAATLTPIVESNGFTLVEEDDVAFSLTLCREIHRIYGTYHEGELKADETVKAGLLLTGEMLSAIRRTVRDGMPAMRIEVAEAQVREMMAILFGQVLPARKDRNRTNRQMGPAVTDLRDRALRPRTPNPVSCAPLRELAQRSEAAPAARPEPELPPARPAVPAPRPRRRAAPVVARVAATLIGCVAVAVLINVPLAVLALYPNEMAPLGAGFVLAGITGSLGYRRWRPTRRWAR